MSWVNWYLLAWNRTFEINGRSRRKEFGYFFLVTALLALVLLGVGVAFGPNEALTTARIRVSMGLYLAVVIVPKSTLTIRRLHDVEISGWLFLLGLVPFAGLVLDMFCLLTDSNPMPNKWGISPKFEDVVGP
jgi:uncharacterized membrane protein YhaH (DUF805 family)